MLLGKGAGQFLFLLVRFGTFQDMFLVFSFSIYIIYEIVLLCLCCAGFSAPFLL